MAFMNEMRRSDDLAQSRTFEGRLERPDQPGSWTFVRVPFDVKKAFGSGARVPVQGTVNGVPFRSSLLPQGDGTHILVVSRDLRAQAGVDGLERVPITLEYDPEIRKAAPPDDLRQALEPAGLAEVFSRLAYSHQKEYIDWITESKRPETRTRRIEKAVEMLRAGKRPKG